ncbi:hypothetical protein RCL1_001657 [Eukaryota sp. TZLM3-RCL]
MTFLPKNLENNFVTPMLTDLYQITMVCSYWQQGMHDSHSVFDLFYRKNPFHGTFALFAGLDSILEFLKTFSFTDEDIEYLTTVLPHMPTEFFQWLRALDTSQVKVYAINQGTFVFPSLPLLRIEGPLAICQLLETTLLNLVNFSTLIATNAARFRLAAGEKANLLEFGLRRAQGPDGAMSASKYAHLGGFNATSNVLAGMNYGIPIKGTHAHAYVQSFSCLNDVNPILTLKDGTTVNFVNIVTKVRSSFPAAFSRTNEGELAAFCAYAVTFPHAFLALVDTYDTLNSGVLNFIVVAKALLKCGYFPVGIRLDSGDLSSLSLAARSLISKYFEAEEAQKISIVASNDISESVLKHLNNVGHSVDVFGIGTMLVTCYSQAALGGVFKLVELGGTAKIKISDSLEKSTLPGRKGIYRLWIDSCPHPICDYLTLADEEAPKVGEYVLVRHPHNLKFSRGIIPTRVEPLLNLVFDQGACNEKSQSLAVSRDRVVSNYHGFDSDFLKADAKDHHYLVGVSENLYRLLHELLERDLYVPTLS